MSKRPDVPNDWHSKTPDEQRAILAWAKVLRAKGRTFNEIAVRLGVTRDTLRRRLDPGFVEIDRAKAKEDRVQNRSALPNRAQSYAKLSGVVRQDAIARLAEVPEDTRSLTGRLLGDPIPQRSALGRAMSGQRGV